MNRNAHNAFLDEDAENEELAHLILKAAYKAVGQEPPSANYWNEPEDKEDEPAFFGGSNEKKSKDSPIIGSSKIVDSDKARLLRRRNSV